MSLTPKFHNEQTHDLLLSLDEAQTAMEQVQVQAEREALEREIAELRAQHRRQDTKLESMDRQLENIKQLNAHMDHRIEALEQLNAHMDHRIEALEQLNACMDRRLENIKQLNARTNQHIKDLCDLFGLRVEDIYTDQPLPAPISTSLTTPIPVNKTLVNTMRPMLAKNASLTLLQWCSALLKKLWHCLQRKPKAESLSLFSAERHTTKTPPATVTTIAAAPGA